jgi:UDP-GlcNAc3NAcA epimerase
MKILTIIGARPQFIKAAVLSKAIAEQKNVEEVYVHTGQHFDENMSGVFFKELGLATPKYNLGIHSLNHGAMTGRMLEQIEAVLLKEKPHWVLVYGDTNSTLAGALAAAKMHIPVAHVEAGLRSHNLQMPEEINRILTDRLSTLNFAPTEASAETLRNEGIPAGQIKVVGDIMYDSVLHYKKQLNAAKCLADLGLKKPFVLATLHREENLSDPEKCQAILGALQAIAKETTVVLPAHPRLLPLLSAGQKASFKIIAPQSYLNMLALLQQCSLVLTDSGGLQKEAFYLQKYCITLREETEWTELLEAQFNFLAGADEEKIKTLFTQLNGKQIADAPNIYGDGTAAKKVVAFLAAASIY